MEFLSFSKHGTMYGEDCLMASEDGSSVLFGFGMGDFIFIFGFVDMAALDYVMFLDSEVHGFTVFCLSKSAILLSDASKAVSNLYILIFAAANSFFNISASSFAPTSVLLVSSCLEWQIASRLRPSMSIFWNFFGSKCALFFNSSSYLLTCLFSSKIYSIRSRCFILSWLIC